MSVSERVRLETLGRVRRKEMTVVAAAEVLGVSLRQARRIWKRFKAEGDAGLVHRLRGRASNRQLSAETAAMAVKWVTEKYADFGPTLACEKLASEHQVVLSPDTLVSLLKARGLWVRRRRRGKHRRRRERRSSFGSMIQMDGSHHDWFEGRGPSCVLMVMIDDATNRTLAWFYPAETTEAAFDVFGRWAKGHGLPRSLYVDRHSIYRDEDHPQKPTQFGRAMNELGVELIQARSPQGKGRVERRHAVFQDRLVKEMRLRNISDLYQANALLESVFLPEINRRYAVKAADDHDLHRSIEAGVNLADVLCVIEQRVVGNDWCVRWQNRWLQIDARHTNLRLPRKKVNVRQRADGSRTVEYQGQRLTTTDLACKPLTVKPKKPVINNRRNKPSPTHPWNKGAEERLGKIFALPAPHGGPAEQKRGRATE